MQPTVVRAWTSVTGGPTLQRPRGVGLLPDGDLAVADEQLQKIVIMSQDGRFRRSIASGGSGPGQLFQPAGVKATAAGDLWVVDRGNHRLQRFSSDGTFLQEVGSRGNGPGQFEFPSAMEIAPNGQLYVCDQGNHRIVRLSAAGAFVSQWGSLGSAAGQFDSPAGIALDRYGDLYVTDAGNHRVQKFTRTGQWIRSWGTSGTTDGQFLSPAGIAVDLLRRVWVGETGGHRIQLFTDRGVFVARIVGSNYGTHATSNVPTGMVANDRGQLFVAEYQSVYVQRFDYQPQPVSPGPFVLQVASFDLDLVQPDFSPADLAADDQGGVYALDGKLVVRHVNRLGQHEGTWPASPDNAYDNFQPPSGIVFHAGRVYVTDPIHGKVRIFERDGTPAGSWGDFPASVPGGPAFLSSIGIDPSGMVSIQSGATISRFDLAGNALGTYSAPAGASQDRLEVDRDGSAWFVTQPGLVRRQSTGAVAGPFPIPPPKLGLSLVHQDPNRGVYVFDSGSPRLRLFDEAGFQLSTLDLPSPPGPFEFYALSLDGDAHGSVWVGDGINDLVIRFATPPRILSVLNQGPDQGGLVRVRFSASSADATSSSVTVTQYELYRRVDPAPADGRTASLLPGWELVATVPATAAATYEVGAATTVDASPSTPMLENFMVRALKQGGVFADSDPVAGHSLDEIAPDTPVQVSAVEGPGGTTLNWQPGATAGTKYRIHRVPSFDVEPHEANAIAETADLTYMDAGVTGAVYAIEAMDDGENLSAPVIFNADGVLGAPLLGSGASFALRGVSPNPSSGERFSVQLSLADSAPASLELFDVSGRRVHLLDLRGLAAGPHAVTVSPASRLVAGMYIVRLRSALRTAERRMLVVR